MIATLERVSGRRDPSKNPDKDAQNSIMAQLDEYDMFCFRLKDHITSMMTSGYLLDLNYDNIVKKAHHHPSKEKQQYGNQIYH